MKFLLFLFIILPLIVSAQTKELQVKGIKVGTYYWTVIKKLGKPLSFKKNGEYPCDGLIRKAKYEGLVIDLLESNLNGKLFVARMEVTSSKWNVLGVKVSDSVNKIRSKFSLVKDKGKSSYDVYTGFNGDSYSYFYFKKNKLVKISWELNAC